MKRLSGGRGEYELAEPAGTVTAADLVGFRLRLDLAPYPARDSGIKVTAQGSKPRLRRENATATSVQLHRQVAAALLFPKPVRDETTLKGGLPVVREGAYVLRKMDIRNLVRGGDTATLRLGALEFENVSGATGDYADAVERLARIRAVHDRSGDLPDAIRIPVERHEVLLSSPGVTLDSSAESLVREIMDATSASSFDTGVDYTAGTDVLPALEAILGGVTLPPPPPIDNVPPEDVELKRREASRWRRWASVRGGASARFRDKVRQAYRSTCMVCGLVLPKNADCDVAGVDAAHILPWASYDLDVTANGLSLCKLHHWAFDQGLIAIIYEAGEYRVKVTRRGRRALAGSPGTLAELVRYEGPIPANRLPTAAADRPRPQFLQRLYEDTGLDLS